MGWERRALSAWILGTAAACGPAQTVPIGPRLPETVLNAGVPEEPEGSGPSELLFEPDDLVEG